MGLAEKKTLIVGVLSLQGGVQEHVCAVQECGHSAVEIKAAEDLFGVDALVLPGGESTTMRLLANERGLLSALKKFVARKPVFGTCAGSILLAKKACGKPGLLSSMDIKVSRNAYGRQVDSFEAELNVSGIGAFHGVFIRAPVIESVGKTVTVLSSFGGKPVIARQGNRLAATFHPELTPDNRIHKFFLDRVAQGF